MADGETRPEVLHVNTGKTWRGGEQQTVYLLRGLAERGLRAEAVFQAGGPAAQRAREVGASVHELPMRTEADLVAAAKIARLARRLGVNILHSHTAHAHTLASLAKNVLARGCRLVVHRRNEYRPGRGLLGLGRLKYRRGVDAYIAISNRNKEILVDYGIEPWRIFTVRSVTDPQRFTDAAPNPGLRRELGIPEDACVAGNIGYLVTQKDHVNLLDAARIAIGKVPNLWIVIVGSGPLRAQVLRRAEELGLSERVVLTGFRDDIPQLIRMFDLFALSSVAEGLGSVLLEVSACGCPIVATDAAGVREAVPDGEAAIIVPTKDPAALAAGIVRLATEPETARRLAAAARERVARYFTVDALTEQTLAVYRRVLAGEVGPAYPVPPAP
jgi:glycosyltransferase involved in cell wall biosynthesis